MDFQKQRTRYNPGEKYNYSTLLLCELITLVDFARAQRRCQRLFRMSNLSRVNLSRILQSNIIPTVFAQLFYFHGLVIISICERYLVTSTQLYKFDCMLSKYVFLIRQS